MKAPLDSVCEHTPHPKYCVVWREKAFFQAEGEWTSQGMEQKGQSEELPMRLRQYSDCSVNGHLDAVGWFGIFDGRVETF